jgi:hypothetical protein
MVYGESQEGSQVAQELTHSENTRSGFGAAIASCIFWFLSYLYTAVHFKIGWANQLITTAITTLIWLLFSLSSSWKSTTKDSAPRHYEPGQIHACTGLLLTYGHASFYGKGTPKFVCMVHPRKLAKS